MGDFEALVIVEAAGFTDGEILLYERLNMVPMLLEEYARNGGERARRQMLAMCEHDPELLSEVLSHFVSIAAEKSNKVCCIPSSRRFLMSLHHVPDDLPQCNFINSQGAIREDASINSETEIGGVFRDIHEALVMAREHGDLPPVRILRILAGEGFGQFSSDNHPSHLQTQCSVPLSVALDYVGAILDDSSRKINRLKVSARKDCCIIVSRKFSLNFLLILIHRVMLKNTINCATIWNAKLKHCSHLELQRIIQQVRK